MKYLSLIGRPTTDAVLKKVGEKGVSLAEFSLAVKERGAGGAESTTFFDIKTWGGTAEWAAKFVKKGKRIFISSDTFGFEHYTDKDGNKRKSFVIVANKIEFADGGAGLSTDTDDAGAGVPTDDDAPRV